MASLGRSSLMGAPNPLNPVGTPQSAPSIGSTASTNPWGAITPVGPYGSNLSADWGAMQNYASQYGVNPSQVQWNPGQGYSIGNVGTPAAAPSYLSTPQYATGGGVTPSQMNPIYYATPGTAQSVAGLVGGNVTPYNMSGAGSSINIPTAQGISVGGQTFDAGVIANLLQRGYSPESLAQQLTSQSGGAINTSPQAAASYLGAPSTGAAPVPGGAGWLPGNVGPTGAGTTGSTATSPATTTLPGAAAGTTTGQTTSGYTTPSNPPFPTQYGGQFTGGQPGAYATQFGPNWLQNYEASTQGLAGPVAAGGPFPGPGGGGMQSQLTLPGGGMGSPFTGTWAPQATPGAYGGNPAGSPDQFLSGLATGGMGGLQGIVAGQGNPISQTPAWNAMVAAQQRNIAEQQAQLDEQFGVSGNRFSSSYGTAETDFRTQTALQQNALLAQMQAQASENAQNRLLSAAGQLGQFGYGAGGQLSAQDFQSQMLQQQQAFNAAQALGGYSYGAAGQLLGAANQAASTMYGGQMGALPQFMTQDQLNQQMAIQSALGASTNWGQNLLTGAQLGGQQYGLNQQALTNLYNQWLYTQPQNNPFVQQAYQLGTYYPSPNIPSYAPGWFGSALGAAGSLAGGLLGNPGLFTSDVRLKENIVPIGAIRGVPIYTYNFRGDPTPQFGPMAQEVVQLAPQAVIPGDAERPWLIKLDKFMDYMLGGDAWAGSQPHQPLSHWA